jgi:hypothetical protein
VDGFQGVDGFLHGGGDVVLLECVSDHILGDILQFRRSAVLFI